VKRLLFTGTANGWSVLNVAGSLTLTAIPSDRFTISLQSLTLSNGLGLAANFNPDSSYSFVLVTTSGGVSNFNAGDFTINTSGFQNSSDGIWSVADVNGNVDLNYSPLSAVPEPSDYAIWFGAAALGFAMWRKQKASALQV
jgi:hypothetical protein